MLKKVAKGWKKEANRWKKRPTDRPFVAYLKAFPNLFLPFSVQEGAIAMAEALKFNTALTKLDVKSKLDQVDLSREGAQALRKSVKGRRGFKLLV